MSTFTAIHTGETKQGQMDIEITSNSAYIDWSLALLQFQDDVDNSTFEAAESHIRHMK